MADIFNIFSMLWERFLQLVYAPVSNLEMLWFALPLAIITLLMALYAGKYREEIGWESAFENTTVYLFVAIDLVRKMYYATTEPSLSNLFANSFYFTLSSILIFVGAVFMIIAYYHLLPKKWAFFAFNYTTVNVSLYVVMSIVYASVPADIFTAISGVVFFLIIYTFLKGIQWLELHAGKEEGIEIIHEKKPGDLAEKFKREAEMIKKKKEQERLKNGEPL